MLQQEIVFRPHQAGKLPEMLGRLIVVGLEQRHQFVADSVAKVTAIRIGSIVTGADLVLLAIFDDLFTPDAK
ncbi:hypothetical protein SDC9_188364 [bioreactor metagenome]|uniref:Uncharacterized protein n=1 Tax=bioreactor metagenome TaxID=1076179 RepID=A0A645HXD1_9ZZZZ